MDDNRRYQQRIRSHAPPSPLLRDCVRAFLVGGGICAVAQGGVYLLSYLGMEEQSAYLTVTVLLILLAALLTGMGVFDRIARFAGAGTLVPVTGFANAVVSPAMDSGSEGAVIGVGAKIFTVAGPVLLFGTLSGCLYGVVLWVVGLFTGGAL